MSAVVVERPWRGAREALRATFFLAGREIRNILRTPAAFIPSMIIPLFFYFVQSASLSKLAGGAIGGNGDYRAFVLPVSLMFAMSNEGAGMNLVIDIERGYFDKLLLSPASRMSLLVGAMGANIARILFVGTVVTTIALAAGVHFATGIGGAVLMVLLASMWGIAYAAVGMGIALKTGNAQATQASFIAVFPLLFLTTSFAPRGVLSPWLQRAVGYNPLTYLLGALRAFSVTGWSAHDIVLGVLAVSGVGLLTVTLAFRALAGRLK